MKTLKRKVLYGLLYGFAIWFIWTALVLLSYNVLPKAIAGSAFFVSMKIVTLVVLLLVAIVYYMKKMGTASPKDGLILGIIWVVVLIFNDLIHYLFMEPAGLTKYLLFSAPVYVIVPIMTTVIMGYLERK